MQKEKFFYIVMVGTLMGGKTFHGTFPAYQDAATWVNDMHDRICGQHWEIIQVIDERNGYINKGIASAFKDFQKKENKNG